MPNVNFKPFRRMSPWRKIAIGTWGHPTDPQAYTSIQVEATAALSFIADNRSARLSPTILVAKGLANAIANNPSANAILRFGRIYQRDEVNIYLPVAPDFSGEALAGVLVREADKKSTTQIGTEIREEVETIRKGLDDGLERSQGIARILPGWLSYPLMRLIGFILFTLNLPLTFLGIEKDPFGSANVTSLGSLGLMNGFSPLDSYARCPIFVTVGKVSEQPTVVEGSLKVRPTFTIGFTFDHRVIDGIGVSRILRDVQAFLASPQ